MLDRRRDHARVLVVDVLADGVRRLSEHPFFARPEAGLSAWSVVWWWEARRIVFNLVVGITGVVTCGLMLCAALVAEACLGKALGVPDPPIVAVFAVISYGVAANLAYTGGWVTELVVRHVWGDPGRDFSRVALTLGLIFSTVLTLAPAGLVGFALIVEVAAHALGSQ